MNPTVVEHFKKIYGPLEKMIAVCDRKGRPVYQSDKLRLFKGITLPESLYAFAAKCIEEQYGRKVQVQWMGANHDAYVTCTSFEGVPYGVIEIKLSFEEPDKGFMLSAMREARFATAKSLTGLFYEAQRLGIDKGKGMQMALDVYRILRAQEHLDFLFGVTERSFYSVPVDINQFLEAFKKLLISLNVPQTVDLDPAEGWTIGITYPNDLQVVLAALVSNAFRFSGKGIKLQTRNCGETVRLTVIDFGAAVKEPDRIFDCGYATNDVLGVCGSGMGLTAAAAILRKHNGRILYEREENRNLFHIELARFPFEGKKFMAKWNPAIPPSGLDPLRVELSDYMMEMESLAKKEKIL